MRLYKLNKNKKTSFNWRKFELKQLSYKYLLFNLKVNKNIKFLLNFFFTKNSTKFFKTKIVNYCIISGRSRWVFRKIFYSRQEFKKAVTLGTFMGIKKACW